MIMHATSLFLVAFAVVLLMAPAAYHRIVYAGEDSEDMHRVGSVLVTAATVPGAWTCGRSLWSWSQKLWAHRPPGSLPAAWPSFC
jgi:hypothetical protein